MRKFSMDVQKIVTLGAPAEKLKVLNLISIYFNIPNIFNL